MKSVYRLPGSFGNIDRLKNNYQYWTTIERGAAARAGALLALGRCRKTKDKKL
jgi:hypothetical protein